MAISAFEGVSQLTIAAILIPGVLAFIVGLGLTPSLLRFLNRHQCWRKTGAVNDMSGQTAPITASLNRDDQRKVPRMGGLVIMAAVGSTVLAFWLLSQIFGQNGFLADLNFVSRGQTWIPLAALAIGFITGLLDDLLVIGLFGRWSKKVKKNVVDGLPLRFRVAIVFLVGLICGWWFFAKLGYSSIDIPFLAADLNLGWVMILIIALVMLATYSGTVIDGIDGLSGGVFVPIFLTYTAISLLQGRFDLAALCLAIVGGLFAFLWYNIPPAKFYMSETGSLGLTLALGTVTFITDTIFLLPLIAAPLVWTVLSNIIQGFSKKFLRRKFFLVSPVHNHFRAAGAPASQVVMRYWVATQVVSLVALAIFLIGY